MLKLIRVYGAISLRYWRPAGPACVVTSLTAPCQPIWFHWVWLWVCVMVGLGSYWYCGCDRLGSATFRPCCSVSFVCSLEFGACVHLRPYFGHMMSFSPTTSVPTTGAAHLSIFIDPLLRPQYQGTVLSYFFWRGGGGQYFLSEVGRRGRQNLFFVRSV